MMQYKFKYSRYKLRNYEKRLALLEVKKIIGPDRYKNFSDEIVVTAKTKYKPEDLEKLTFFSEVVIKNETIATTLIPRQVKYELSAKFLKKTTIDNNELFNFIANGPHKTRQFRYLTHLMHEYKGRYNPQLCKSLINISGISKGSLVLDPFSGSGTTLVECFLNGHSAIGIDLNPLSYLITKTKIDSFLLDIPTLKLALKNFAERLSNFNANSSLDAIIRDQVFNGLDTDYLKSWFPPENLKKILFILKNIYLLKDEKIKNLFLLALSDILRDLSFQDPTQLRIKRRPEKDVDRNVFEAYLNKLDFYSKIIDVYQFVKPPEIKGSVKNFLWDVRLMRKQINISEQAVDLIVTSPPYATALPYIDTDRLSLFLFGYINRTTFRNLEKEMIGNREITKREKDVLEDKFFANHNQSMLPAQITRLIKRIYTLNSNAAVGFRRKNTAALLYKYFNDMQLAMVEMYHVLKHGKYCFMVVGSNNTTAGNQKITIPTDDYIGLIGKKVGFKLATKIPMSVAQSYMIHRNNAIPGESVLVFKKE